MTEINLLCFHATHWFEAICEGVVFTLENDKIKCYGRNADEKNLVVKWLQFNSLTDTWCFVSFHVNTRTAFSRARPSAKSPEIKTRLTNYVSQLHNDDGYRFLALLLLYRGPIKHIFFLLE